MYIEYIFKYKIGDKMSKNENNSSYGYIAIVAIVAIVAVVVMMSGNAKVQSTDLTGQATSPSFSKMGGEQVNAPGDECTFNSDCGYYTCAGSSKRCPYTCHNGKCQAHGANECCPAAD